MMSSVGRIPPIVSLRFEMKGDAPILCGGKLHALFTPTLSKGNEIVKGNRTTLKFPFSILFDQDVIILASTDITLILEDTGHLAVTLARRGLAVNMNDLVTYKMPHAG